MRCDWHKQGELDGTMGKGEVGSAGLGGLDLNCHYEFYALERERLGGSLQSNGRPIQMSRQMAWEPA